jgi:glutathione S-transferase
MRYYFSTGSCSLASQIVLEELGIKYEPRKLNLREGDQRKPEFLKLNPKAKVPALELDDGQVLTENPAIMSWLADTHPEGGLLAPVGQLERARAQEWLAWCASTIHAGAFGPVFGAARIQDAAAKQAAMAKALPPLQAQLDLFDAGLAGKRYVLGDKLSIADAYTLVFFSWAKSFGLTIGDNFRRSAATLLERDGVKRALAVQGLKLEA